MQVRLHLPGSMASLQSPVDKLTQWESYWPEGLGLLSKTGATGRLSCAPCACYPSLGLTRGLFSVPSMKSGKVRSLLALPVPSAFLHSLETLKLCGKPCSPPGCFLPQSEASRLSGRNARGPAGHLGCLSQEQMIEMYLCQIETFQF